MEKLTGALLKALCDKPDSLHAAVDALGRLAPTPSERESQIPGMASSTYIHGRSAALFFSELTNSYKELVSQYKGSQAAMKGETKKKKSVGFSTPAGVPLFAVYC